MRLQIFQLKIFRENPQEQVFFDLRNEKMMKYYSLVKGGD